MSDAAPVRRGKRSGRHLLMLVISLGCGAAGVYLARQYIEEQVDQYRSQLEQTEAMTQVVVPVRSLIRGERLSADDLAVRDIPERYADSNSVTNNRVADAVGQRIDFDIDEGRPLLWAHLEGGRSPTFSGRIPDGQRALTVRVDEINSISGFLQPGDRVDLLLSHGAGDRQKIFPLIQKLDVIATGLQTSADKDGIADARSFTTITVRVTPEEAKRITLAQAVGRVTATLRNPEDQTALRDTSIGLSDLLIGRKPAEPTRRSKRAEPAIPPIQYIIGGAS